MLISSHAIYATLDAPFIASGWQEAVSPFDTTNINSVTGDREGKYVAVGSSGKIATSVNNAVTWSLETSPFSGSNLYSVTYGDGIFIAGGSNGKIATSSDGESWTLRNSSFGASTILGIIRSDPASLWIAVGASGKLATSVDGIEWTQRTSSFGVTFINNIHSSPNLLVAAGFDGKIATSTNGTTWTQRSSSFVLSTIFDVSANSTGTEYVAVGDSGKIATSANGTSWTQIFPTSSFGSSSIKSVGNNADGYLAAGSAGKIATSSPQASSWKQRASGLGLTNINDVYYSDTIGIAVANSGRIIYSL
jgi:photosystem II stability/assembly factor-like uncharacterized protein